MSEKLTNDGNYGKATGESAAPNRRFIERHAGFQGRRARQRAKDALGAAWGPNQKALREPTQESR